MKYEIKKLPKNQVQIVVEIPVDAHKPHLEKAAQLLVKDSKISGFRPGKVPYDILKEKLGESAIYQEAAHLIVEKTYPDICQKEKLLTVASPKVEVIKVAPGNPFIYKVIVPLLPRVTLGDYKKFKSQKNKVEVKPEQVEKVLQDLRQMRATEVAADKAIAKGDKAEIDFQIFMDKVAIEGGQGNKFAMIVGEGYFIPGFEDQLIGMTKGQEKKFQLTFPKNYFQKNLANREGDFQVKVVAVYERKLPELNDNFAKTVGNKFLSFNHLKQELTKNLEQEEQRKEDQRFELALLEEIIGRSQFEEIPEILIEAELDKMIAELRAEIESRQLKFDDYLKSIKQSVENLRGEFNDKAIKRVKTALVSREIAETEDIDANDEEVAAEINKTMQLYAGDEDIKKRLATPQYFTYLKNVMISKKVFQFLDKLASK
ncbi:MAG: trigger factor [Patescibacteria group bacterium]